MSPPGPPAGGTGGAGPHEAARPLGKSSVWGRAAPSCCEALGTWLPSLSLTFPSRMNGDTRVRRAAVRTQAESRVSVRQAWGSTARDHSTALPTPCGICAASSQGTRQPPLLLFKPLGQSPGFPSRSGGQTQGELNCAGPSVWESQNRATQSQPLTWSRQQT